MNRFLILVVFLGIFTVAFTQCSNVCGSNLLVNPGFEVPTANCSVNDIQIYSDQTPVQGWLGTEPFSVNPMTGSTPDYFSPCAGSTNAANANCMNGTARIGLFTKTSFGNGREYVQSQLNVPLAQGKTYCFSMVVKSKVGAAGNVLSSCDGIGAWFHNIGVINIESMNGGTQFLGPGSTVNATPQVENPSGNLIGGTCVTVSGTFCAQGGETHIVIGNFRDDANTQISGSNPSNYMYVEDVQLFEICPPTIDLMALPQNISCGGSTTLTLASTFPAGTSYNWTSPAGNALSGSGPFTVSPQTTTTYTVIANYTNNCGVQSDTSTVTVTVGPCGVSAQVFDTILCAGVCHDLFAYNPSGGVPPYSYSWTDAGGNTIATGQGPHTVCPSNSTYYSLIITDDAGAIFTDTLQVEVVPYPVVNASDDTTVCSGETVVLSGLNSGGLGQWENFGAGNTITVTPAATTTYVFTAVNQGCSASDSVTVTVLDLPQATLSGTNVSCYGLSDGIVWISPAGTYTCQWQPSGITGDTLQQLSAGWYYAQITDSNGCSVQDSVQVTTPPVLQLSLSGNTSVCSGETTQLTANVSGGTPGYTILWNNGQWNGTTVTIQPNAGTTIPVSVVDAAGCSRFDSIALIVNPIPVAGFTSGLLICSGTDTLLINTSSGASSFAWWVNQQPAGTMVNLPFSENNPGCYDIQLIATNTFGCTDTLTQSCAVEVQETANASVSSSASVLTIDYPTTDLINLSTGSTDCQWLVDGNLFHIGCESSLSYTFPETGNYIITLIASNSAGCSDKDSLLIQVHEGLIYYVPNAFTPDGDEHNNLFRPVFTSGFSPESFQMEIFDRWGEILFESYDCQSGWDGTYHGSMCKEGVYTWTITFKDLYTDENYTVHGSLTLIR